MKRTQDKIKDYVEAQDFEGAQRFAREPARALAAYRFTDATSDLLARWLDALADLPRGRGTARALAGLRGVGKSHTLAAFGAIVAFPELRATVEDAHVATSARRLLNRRAIVARVERGTRPTLLEEVAAAFSSALGGDEEQWGSDPAMMMAIAASRAPEMPLVVVIDTAFGREARVSRNDGPTLSALARATEHASAFLALALDDDIADASGVNAVLAGTYQIDYLDPEHLYRVADLHVLRKTPQAREALHEIYLGLRAAVPGFNWSEPRFAAVYPVHPLIADVAAAVRLYAPNFAFLPFASAAAQRAAGRPAMSLVLLDEVFDRTEQELRKAPELEDAFAVYDHLATQAVGQLPVMQRLEAKLILKALFILSLDGSGATARSLCAAMLFYDENAPEAVLARVETVLMRFAEAAPAGALVRGSEGGETHYRFLISATSRFETALAESIARLPPGDALSGGLLRAAARARFEDWPLLQESGEVVASASFHLAWRGSERRGLLRWPSADTVPNLASSFAPEASAPSEIKEEPSAVSASSEERSAASDPFAPEWEIIVLAPEGGAPEAAARDPLSEQLVAPFSFIWRPGALTDEERDVLRRLAALKTDGALLADYGETARSLSSQLHSQAERIWSRLYLEAGALVSNKGSYQFTDEARAAGTLAAALSLVFAPLFDARYTEHPVFADTLSEADVARLIGGFFGGANAAEAATQDLARLFAAPLGLAAERGGAWSLVAGDEALARPWIRETLTLTDAAAGEVVPLAEARRALNRAPYGLQPEAQNLIFAALVAQRRIELVTATGDRISRRTLDRALKWDGIAGIARAAEILHSAAELTNWARFLTGREDLASIADPAARESARVALSEWLAVWRERDLLRQFAELPDEALTVRAWNLASAVRRSFGAAADAIEATLADDVSLEEGLQRVADTFADSPEQFTQSAARLIELSAFVEAARERERARAYLCAAAPTGADEIDSARRELLLLAADAASLFDEGQRERFALLWQEFQARYIERYALEHDRAVGSASDRRALDALLRSEGWREFETLAELPLAYRHYWEEAEALLERANGATCDLPVRQLLAEHPACACSFSLARAADLAALPQELEATMELARAAYRRTFAQFGPALVSALESLAQGEGDTETSARLRALAAQLAEGHLPERFARAEVRALAHAYAAMPAPPPIRAHLPAGGYGLVTREELRARLGQWLDDLPEYPALIEVTGDGE